MPCRSGIVCPLCRQDWGHGERYTIADAVAALLENHKNLQAHHTEMETSYEQLQHEIGDIELAKKSLRERSKDLKARSQALVGEEQRFFERLAKGRQEALKECTEEELIAELKSR